VDQHCRITVVGERRQADLAVPAGAPIASYVGALARLCGQPRNDIMPAAWSLAPALGSPFAPERSLAELGVFDGAVLYLSDAIGQEFADPVVHDVAERVAEVAESRLHRRWNARARTFTIFAFGLGWLVAALIVLAARHEVGTATLEDLAVVFGILLPALAWTATEREWPVPRQLRRALALSAVPFLALAAHTISSAPYFSRLDGPGDDLTRAGLTAAALVVGALIGALLAYVAAPSEVTCVVLLAALIGAILGVGLAAARASFDQSAMSVAVVGFALLMLSPMTAARIVAFIDGLAQTRAAADEQEEDPVDAAVGRAATVLVGWSGSLAPMAVSHSGYCAAAAGCLGLALLLRAGVARLTSEVVPLLLAGAVGLFTLLTVAPGHAHWPTWTSPVGTVLIGAVLIVYGLRRLMRRPELPALDRPRWMSNFSSMLGGTGAALAIAAFGVFGWFVQLGHHI
jgi:uncharacterized membrane protein